MVGPALGPRLLKSLRPRSRHLLIAGCSESGPPQAKRHAETVLISFARVDERGDGVCAAYPGDDFLGAIVFWNRVDRGHRAQGQSDTGAETMVDAFSGRGAPRYPSPTRPRFTGRGSYPPSQGGGGWGSRRTTAAMPHELLLAS